MRLTIYNGSPRGKRGNTEVLINNLLAGFLSSDNTASVNYLVQSKKMREFVGKFQNAENIIIAFPLYTDSMPGIVKDFIEALQDIKFYTENQRIGFIIHCGFPESIHLDAIEKYLEKLSKRLGIRYIGTIKKGGSEGLRLTPEKYNKNLFYRLKSIGLHYAKKREFSQSLLNKINKNKKFPSWIIPILKFFNRRGLFDTYWNKSLKKNNAFEIRYNKPFE